MRVNSTALEILPLKRYVFVREMTVAEIRVFLQTPGDSLRNLLCFTDLSPAEIDQLSGEEGERLMGAALELNAAFFVSEDRGQKTEDRRQRTVIFRRVAPL